MDWDPPKSNRTRIVFALAGISACLIAALIAEPILGLMHAATLMRRYHAASLLYLTKPGTTTRTIQPPTATISDSEFERRLSAANAQSGEVQVSLTWNNRNDLDLGCQEPSGEMVDGYNQQSRSGGVIDIDMNSTPQDDLSPAALAEDIRRHGRQRAHRTAMSDTAPVENLVWNTDPPVGHYKVFVHQYCNKEHAEQTPFWVVVNVRGKITRIAGTMGSEDFASDLVEPKLMYEFDVAPPQPIAAAPVVAPKPPSPPPPITVRRTAYWLWRLDYALLTSAIWGALIGLLPLALLVAQRLYLRQRPLRGGDDFVVIAAGPATGIFAAIAGQLVLGLLAAVLPRAAMPALFVLGWALLGGVFGFVVSLFTPNVGRLPGLFAGMLSALAGALLFLVLSVAGMEPFGHIVTAALVGGSIGALIALPERERPSEPEPAPPPPPERPTFEVPPPFIVHGTRTRKVGGLRQTGPPRD